MRYFLVYEETDEEFTERYTEMFVDQETMFARYKQLTNDAQLHSFRLFQAQEISPGAFK